MLKKSLITFQDGKCPEHNIVKGVGYRISVLTPRIFRIEIADEFCDKPTQSIWFRNFSKVDFIKKQDERFLYIRTDYVELKFDIIKKAAECILFLDENRMVEVSNKYNLKGTKRTLDMTFGPVKLGDGLLSKQGVSIIDDTKSLIINDDGTIAPRPHNPKKDLYVFAFGKDYRSAIKEFYQIAGNTPIIPRYALGVWWSRYRAYTQEEYCRLIKRFFDEKIPLSVATIDMDWHWVNLEEQFNIKDKAILPFKSSGWTGYSWNTKLFPDYKGFLKYLKDQDLKVTVNLHPADGIRYFEDMYEEMAKAMDIDPTTKKTVEFDVSSTKFWNNYFDIVHKPYEKDGVDFWWIDWQQGKKSQIEGLDPLWALNHFHYLDNSEDGRIPLILSRFAGAGSHRYPLGFSGDTAINWKVLDFQPYFTLTASNIGYTWWSHDIGGHHHGYRDEELYARWLQYGAFSPIMRLHSTSNDLLGKEPWMYSQQTASVAKDFLRLRHSLIPYLYTMDYINYKEGLCLTEPMYYQYPDNDNAYAVKNQFMLGNQLMICPVTTKMDKNTKLAKTKVWIPTGRWVNIFNKKVYNGDKVLDVYSDLSQIPAFIKEGGIIPMSNDEGNSTSNPKNLRLLCASGNGQFTLYEDNGKTDFEKHNAQTDISISLDKQLQVTVFKAKGDLTVIPSTRNIEIEVIDIKNVGECVLCIDNIQTMHIEKYTKEFSDNTFKILIEDYDVTKDLTLTIKTFERLENPLLSQEVMTIFSRWQKGTLKKSLKYRSLKGIDDKTVLAEKLKKKLLPRTIKGAILEAMKR